MHGGARGEAKRVSEASPWPFSVNMKPKERKSGANESSDREATVSAVFMEGE